MQSAKWAKKIPNIITMANMVLGISAIFILIRTSYPGREMISVGLILGGAVLDALDGTIARKLNAVTAMGKQLDSFADLITFGVAPICLVHHLEMYRHSLLIALFAWFFPLAGAYRLARYNLHDFSNHFMGLPITAAGMILTLYCAVVIRWFSGANAILLVSATIILVLSLSWMMVSKVKINRISFGLPKKVGPRVKERPSH